MAEYHIGCGLAGIYAGTLKPNKNPNKPTEWKDKTMVTDEAIEAVRDWIVWDCLGGLDCSKGARGGYTWTLKDGRTVKLLVSIGKDDYAKDS